LKQVFYFFIFITLPVFVSAQQADSILPGQTDTSAIRKDSVPVISAQHKVTFQDIVKESKFLNISGKPIAMANEERKYLTVDGIFYALLAVVTFLAFLRLFYVRYFNNLFQVFFNTSLRQSQLTDQLLQARLPSLFFNLIWIFSGGFLTYFLLIYFGWQKTANPLTIIPICIAGITIIYFFKFISLKFTGWVTGFREATNTYIFIIFLINKILGILLLPLIIIIAFAAPVLMKVAVLAAILLTGIMFLLRFLRSYGLLQKQLRISRVHFLIYIMGMEILPVLLIYKGVILLLSKNL
jgi:hypothetical protein